MWYACIEALARNACVIKQFPASWHGMWWEFAWEREEIVSRVGLIELLIVVLCCMIPLIIGLVGLIVGLVMGKRKE